ncbi:hypothetical protein TOPH_09006 [Tolypocladium ophioglossoides CBS 100239]|uniref:Uncharacterized protein n=1 Tax=Tolypocladium ophioglossoides (strain CBS 100239) TaxID=1163406 RepID=A0A0L0MX34_TOLOC|nr:hypothetical protein TOPH_09006 [Tolypocladium ophioglossoides CBS 100239]
MASKLTPFLLRSGVRTASRIARPQTPPAERHPPSGNSTPSLVGPATPASQLEAPAATEWKLAAATMLASAER